jgi:hypothetical protein
MEDPGDAFKTVSARNYDRNLTNKLYEISNNVSPQQLQSIIADNVKIENENSLNLNVPSSSSSSFSHLDSLKKEDNEFLSLPGEDMDSEDDTENESATECASESEILTEDPNLLIQNNNNKVASRSKDFIPHQSDESLARKLQDDRNKKDPSLKNFI